jgi:chloramphenicol 3-O-phosphotransferase
VSSASTKDTRRGVVLVTGAQAAGKSTVGRLLAERFDRGAFIEGDLMWKLVVSGAQDMGGDRPSDEAVRQYLLRLRHGAMLGDSLFESGFTAVHADIVMGESMPPYLEMVRSRPRYVVMLRPSIESVVARERARPKTAYRDLGPTLEDAVRTFYGWIDATERVGLWLDSSEQTPDETVDEIMSRVWTEGLVP